MQEANNSRKCMILSLSYTFFPVHLDSSRILL